MSLGLCVADDNNIYLAIESMGVPSPPHRTYNFYALTSKIMKIQDNPEIFILVTGGLGHWADVIIHYHHCDTIEQSSDLIVDILRRYTDNDSLAFGLLCGFQASNPLCYRINCFGPLNCSYDPNPIDILHTVREIGQPPYAGNARAAAQTSIDNHNDYLLSLINAIEGQIERHTGERLANPNLELYFKKPIHVARLAR